MIKIREGEEEEFVRDIMMMMVMDGWMQRTVADMMLIKGTGIHAGTETVRMDRDEVAWEEYVQAVKCFGCEGGTRILF